MKRKVKWIVTGVFILVVGILCMQYIIKNEQQRKYPIERYLEQKDEKQQTDLNIASNTEGEDKFRAIHSFTIGDYTYEFIGYEMVEDTEIEKQTKYKAEYFHDGTLPDADEIQENLDVYDMDRLYGDYPEYYDLVLHQYDYSYKDYLQRLDKSMEGLDWSKYSLGKGHRKTYYYFVKLRVTNHSDADREFAYHTLYLIRTNEEKSYNELTDCKIYFDKPQHTEGDDRIHRFTWYTMKPNETLECIIGFKMDAGIDYNHPERHRMYIGTMTAERQNTWVNQTISETVVPLYDLPQIERE